MSVVRSIDRFEYSAPASLNEALRIMDAEQAAAKILNGGTDLVLQMKQGLANPSTLVDVKKIPELHILEWTQSSGLRIGAAIPITRMLGFQSLPKEYVFLLKACSLIGSTQIKNRGTIGGNICNAAPSADSVPSLLCLDAKVVLASTQGSRTVPLKEFFLGPGKTVMENNEILMEIIVPTPPSGSAGSYLRQTTRKEMDIAVAGVASWIEIAPQDKMPKTVRIALGAVGPTPIRAHQAEESLIQKPLTLEMIENAADKAVMEAKPISDLRGSAEYRHELIRVLTRRTLQNVWKELGIQS